MIDVYGQSYNESTYLTYVVTKTGATAFTITYANISTAYGSNAALFAALTAKFANSFFIENTDRQNEELTVNSVYYSCLALTIGDSFTFSTSKEIVRKNLELENPLFVSAPFEFSAQTDGELDFVGTLPTGGVSFFVGDILVYTLSDTNMQVATLLESTIGNVGDITLPVTYKIISDFGYDFGTFTIESFNEYEDASQLFGTELQVTVDDYDIDDADDFNRDRFLEDIDFITTNEPTPEYTAQSYHLAEIAVKGVTYSAIVYGNIPNGIRIDSSIPKNKPVLNAIWNDCKYYDGESEREEFDSSKAKYKITLFYI